MFVGGGLPCATDMLRTADKAHVYRIIAENRWPWAVRECGYGVDDERKRIEQCWLNGPGFEANESVLHRRDQPAKTCDPALAGSGAALDRRLPWAPRKYKAAKDLGVHAVKPVGRCGSAIMRAAPRLPWFADWRTLVTRALTARRVGVALSR